jgi:hypothetical protein
MFSHARGEPSRAGRAPLLGPSVRPPSSGRARTEVPRRSTAQLRVRESPINEAVALPSRTTSLPRRRRSAMDRQGRRLAELRSLLPPQPHNRPPPWLGSVEAQRTVCSIAGRRASPDVGQPRLAPLATAPHRPQGHLDPNSGRESNHGDSLTPLPTFPGRVRRRSTGIWAGAAGNHAQGPNYRRPALSREFYAN